ncbi:hypothetical protein, partial [Klebsiella pneumoniae]|uniref:hypothetical protein n=1 Tax=Klebsiella pneumoniae TaxID=573 RepID=UPI003EDF17F9
NLKADDGKTALIAALIVAGHMGGNLEVAKLLLSDSRIDKDIKDGSAMDASAYASRYKLFEIFNMLNDKPIALDSQ